VTRLLDSVLPAASLSSPRRQRPVPDEIAAFEKILNEFLPGDRHVGPPHHEVQQFFDGPSCSRRRRPGQRVASRLGQRAGIPTTLWGGVGRVPA